MDVIEKPKGPSQRETIVSNIKAVALYSLSMVVALGLNDVVLNIFDSFPNSQHVISKVTYIVIMFGLTLLVALQLARTETD